MQSITKVKMEMSPIIQAKDSDLQQGLLSLCLIRVVYFSFIAAEEKYEPVDM